MSEENKHIDFTARDIEKYHKGQLSGREMHAIEKAALNDPFLAEALEGYAAGKTNAVNDIEELKIRLADRIEGAKIVAIPSARKQKFLWLRAAAMIVLVAGAGLLVYQFAFNKKSTAISKLNSTEKQEGIKDSVPATTSVQQSSSDSMASLKLSDQAQKDNAANSKNERQIEANGGAALSRADKTDSATVKQLVVSKDEEARVDDAAKRNLATVRKSSKEDIPAKKSEEPVTESAAPKAADEKTRAEMQGLATQKMKENEVQAKTLNNGYINNQSNAFRGRVIDPNNNPVPFANISNTRDKLNTYADANGIFNLVAADSILNVEIRSVGFENNNTQLRSDIPNNQVVLKNDKNALAEVVVVNKNANKRTDPRLNPFSVEEPEPADGWENYDAYLLNNVNIPEEAKARSLNGDVQLSFEINKKGNPVNIKVVKSLCQSCDQEAIRVVQSGPKWKKKAKKAKASVKVSF